MSRIEYSYLSPEYQQWLTDKNLLIRRDEIPEVCPGLISAQRYNPRVVAVEKKLHKTPFLIVPYPHIAESLEVEDSPVVRSSIQSLLYKARRWGCTMSSVQGFGASVGVKALELTPTQIVLLDAIRAGATVPELAGLLGQDPVRVDSFDQRSFKALHLKVEISRLRKKLSKVNPHLIIQTDEMSRELKNYIHGYLSQSNITLFDKTGDASN